MAVDIRSAPMLSISCLMSRYTRNDKTLKTAKRTTTTTTTRLLTLIVFVFFLKKCKIGRKIYFFNINLHCGLAWLDMLMACCNENECKSGRELYTLRRRREGMNIFTCYKTMRYFFFRSSQVNLFMCITNSMNA